MKRNELDLRLDALEEQIGALAASLNGDNPQDLQVNSLEFQRMAVALGQAMDRRLRPQSSCEPDQLRRIQRLGGGLVAIREGILRRTALVDRALSLIIPASGQKATYGETRVYGMPVRQSGAFTRMSA